jgi:hypothetical protein
MRGSLYIGADQYLTDRGGDFPISSAALRARAANAGQEVTFTCVPPGSGSRIALDQDEDGAADGDERDAATDPANAGSTPVGAPIVCATSTPVVFKRATLNDRRGILSLTLEVDLGTYTQETVGLVVTDSDGPITTATVAGLAIEPKGSGFRYRAPIGAVGIKTLNLREKRNSGGRFKITLRTTDAWTPGAANQSEASTLVTLNIGGRCFRGAPTKVR